MVVAVATANPIQVSKLSKGLYCTLLHIQFFYMFPGCKSEDGNSCYFPFNYNGVTYYECTKVDSSLAWCATKVDSNCDVIYRSWEDCNPGCPGTSGNIFQDILF